jgi:hypothetical protein
MNGIVIYIGILIILFIILRYNYTKKLKEEKLRIARGEYLDINKYFYDADNLRESKRRKLWVHIPFEKNARKWENFGSRNTYQLNLPYMTLCIKSIVDNCSEYYDIIIFDDTNIHDILKDMDIDLSKISGSLLDKYREICMMKILYEYGGIIVPPSLFLKRSLEKIDNEDTWYVIDSYNSQNDNLKTMLPSTILTGSNKHNKNLKKYISYLEQIVLKDFGESSIHYSANYFLNNKIPILDGALVGIRDARNNPVRLEDLMANKELHLRSDNIGLYMPHEELLHRKAYQWYCYLSVREVLEASVAFSYYISNSKGFAP